jgi:hypothetical protein
MTKRNIEQSPRPFWRRNKLPTAVVCAALGCAAVWYASDRLIPETVLPDGEVKMFSFHWKNGATYTYALTWKAQQTNRIVETQETEPGQQTKKETTRVSGSVDAQADLLLRSYGKAGDVHVMGLSLASVDKFAWQVLGESVVKDPKALFDKSEAFLEVEPSGRIRQTFFASNTPSEFRGFVQWLTPQLQFVLPKSEAEWDAHAWSVVEETSHGRAKSSYSASEDEPLELSRTRASYETLLSSDIKAAKYTSDDVAHASCSSEGHIESIESHSKLDVSEAGEATLAFENTFSLELKDITEGPARRMLSLRSDAFQGYAPTETPNAEAAQEQALANRVGNLTPGQMVSDVLEFANGGRMSQRWLWQATGLLQQNPEACAELGEVFGDDSFSQQGRGLILDLLASAGTPEAQKVLRDLLASKAAKADQTSQAVLFNRVGLVSEATPETAEFIAEQFDAAADEPMGPMRIASAYAMGSVAGAQADQGNAKAAAELNARIVTSLEAASAPEEKAVMLRALGNTGLEENVDTLVDYTKHGETRVRAAAASALRDTHNEQSMSALLDLLRDPEWEVQQAALSSLARYTLTADEARRIEELVVSGVVGSRNDPLLVTVLARNATVQQPLAAGFGHVLARNMNNGQLAARIRAVARRNGVTL